MSGFHLTVRLAEPLREGVGETIDIATPVRNIGELVAVLEARLPAFAGSNDELYNFAINGELLLHGEKEAPLASGDEVELLVAFAGG